MSEQEEIVKLWKAVRAINGVLQEINDQLDNLNARLIKLEKKGRDDTLDGLSSLFGGEPYSPS